MVRGFFDENSDDLSFYAIGGWVSNVQAWQCFADLWVDALVAPPSIEYFSHHEAMGLRGEFEGWSERDRDTKLLRLAETICTIRPYAMIGVLNLAEFSRIMDLSVLSRKQLKSVIRVTHAYHWCFCDVTAAVLQYQLSIGQTDTVDFVFDEQSGLFDECATHYRAFRDKIKAELAAIAGTVTQADEKQVVPLQASDLLLGQYLSVKRDGVVQEPWRLLAGNCTVMESDAGQHVEIWQQVEQGIRELNIVWSTKVLSDILSRK